MLILQELQEITGDRAMPDISCFPFNTCLYKNLSSVAIVVYSQSKPF